MPVKLSMRVRFITVWNNLAKQQREAVWRERYYVDANTVNDALNIVRNGAPGGGGAGLMARRAALLPRQATIDNIWLQPMLANAIVGLGEYPSDRPTKYLDQGDGSATATCDFPQQAMLLGMKLQGGQPKTPRLILKGVPDGYVTSGELDLPDQDPYKAAIRAFMTELEAAYGTYVNQQVGASFQPRRIDTITDAGLLTYTGLDPGWAVNMMVNVTHTTNEAGRRVGGKYRIKAVTPPPASSITLLDWDKGQSKGGLVRQWYRVFARFLQGGGEILQQTTKKVGSGRDYRGQNRRSRV